MTGGPSIRASLFSLALAICLAAETADAGPLEDAVTSGDVERVRKLLDEGADPNGQEDAATTPLHQAIAGRQHGVAALLMDRGADVNRVTELGGTPLHVAAATGDAEAVLLLVEQGANLTARRSRDGFTPLHVAADGGSVEIVRVLLAGGADVNALAPEKVGAPPLHFAEVRRHSDVARILREAEAAPPSVEPIAPLLASADPERGEALFAENCGPCHSAGSSNYRARGGPPLTDIVGRAIGSSSEFTYSIAMETLDGRWDVETLNAFLAHPMATVPGTRMSEKGLATPGERADVIAFLRSVGVQLTP